MATLQTRQQGSSFLTELKQRLLLSPSEATSAGTRYNVPLINSLVLYAGMQVYSGALVHVSLFTFHYLRSARRFTCRELNTCIVFLVIDANYYF